MDDSHSDNSNQQPPRPYHPNNRGWITPPPEGWDDNADNTREPAGGQEPAGGNESQARQPAAGHPYLNYGSQAATVAATPPKKSLARRIFRDIILPLMIAFAVAMFVQATVAKPYKIPSGSMLPTIKLGDRVLANRVIYHFQDIDRGDVVVFEPPAEGMAEPGVPFIKRVVGLPGDTVEVVAGKTLVNGEVFDVPDADVPRYTRPPELVPEGYLFVLGDNRNQSSDSHIWGVVPMENVIGRVEMIYWPPAHVSLM